MYHYSFFTISGGFIGYPSDVVKLALLEKTSKVLDTINVNSNSISKNIMKSNKNTSLTQVGGGLFVPSIRLLQYHPEVLVSEVLPHDIDHYMGRYEPITSQVQQEYIEVMSNVISDKLQNALILEYQQWDAYIHYSTLIFGFSRDSIIDEFIEHASDEQSHILLISEILVNAGIRPTTKRIGYQEATDTSGILKLQLDMEEKAVNSYKEVVKLITDESSTISINVQGIMQKEDEHMRELRSLLRYA